MATIPPDIMAAALASQDKWGVPASITLAQWAIESGWGKSMPPDSNNPFGIKAKPGQPTVGAMTREVVDGKDVHAVLGFRKYASLSEAFDDHGRLLATVGAYAPARAALPDVDAFADRLTGVYATDPHYGAKLREIMAGNDLYRLNLPTMRRGKAPPAAPPTSAAPPKPQAKRLTPTVVLMAEPPTPARTAEEQRTDALNAAQLARRP